MNKEKQDDLKTMLIIFFILLGFIGGTILGYHLPEEENECTIIKQLLTYEQNEIDLVDDVTEIYDYYTECSNGYDYDDLEHMEYYCQKTRDKGASYSQKLREIKVEIPEDEKEIFDLRRQMIEIEIEYLFALYEASEYMESAQRAYDSGNYVMGDANIEGQNERIRDHDNGIEDYSNLQAEYNKLKRELLQ